VNAVPDLPHPTRRDALARGAGLLGLMAAAGLLPTPARAAWTQAAFDARNLPDVVKALGGATPVASRDVSLQAPEMPDNSASVLVNFGCSLPGVRRMALLIEKNPNVLSAVFDPTEAVEPNFAVRVKLAQTGLIYAVAMMGDGRVLYAQREVRVTLGACGT
jgi:sulfur-oxidizing protein SoxY